MSIIEIKKSLERKQTTSVKLVMDAIKKHESFIDKNALAHVSPYALYQAQILDQERNEGKIRGPLHGIPLVIKDNILYQDGTPTTANAFSLSDLIPPFNAHLVDLLIQSGAIILGKANLSEFAYFMSDEDMPSGYGLMYGQVKHPFNESIDPYGSSTGSAVAVKLGIVDISVGTETNGSLMAPAYQCQIVSYKPSFGFVSKHGIIPISPTQDTAGPMAHTVEDCALLMDVFASEDKNDLTTLNLKRPKSFSMKLNHKLRPSKIGLIVIKNDLYDETERMIIEKTTKRLNSLGHQVVEITIDKGHIPNELTLFTEFKYAMNSFLNQVNGATQMKTLHDIIEFNQKNERRCLRYGQSILIKSNETSENLEDDEYKMNREILISHAKLLEDLMIEHDLISMISPRWMGFAPIYGNPSVVIPEGIYQGIPKAMVFVGKKYDDETLLQLTHQYQMIGINKN